MLHLIFSNAALSSNKYFFNREDMVVLMPGVSALDAGVIKCSVIDLSGPETYEDKAGILLDLIENAKNVRSYY